MTDTGTSPERSTDVTENGPDETDRGPLQRLTDALGLPPRPAPLRRWVQSASAGHLSGLVWGAPKSEIVLVHDLGDSSNGWDAVALSSGRDMVALDLPGHGRSSTADAIKSPAKQSPALLDAIRSFAPSARLIVASGLGAAIALQAAIKRPASLPALLVVDGGPLAAGITPLIDPDGFASADEAAARLASVAPRRHPAVVRHLAEETTVPRPDGRLEWRSQLGEPPAELEGWMSVEQFGAAPVRLGVVTATGDPVDPLVRSILQHWPDTPHLVIGPNERAATGDLEGGDLVASRPVEVARAIDDFLATLAIDPALSTVPTSGATA